MSKKKQTFGIEDVATSGHGCEERIVTDASGRIVNDPLERLVCDFESLEASIRYAFEVYLMDKEGEPMPASLTPAQAKWMKEGMNEVATKIVDVAESLEAMSDILVQWACRRNPDLREFAGRKIPRPGDPEWEEMKALSEKD
jgi:hypothetical protein